MRYNDSYIDKQVITDVENEPVTLDEVKRHLNLLFDTSGSYTFNDDDTYLTDLIPQCREIIEEYTGLSLAEKDLKVVVRNELGGVEIPWGPINDIASTTDAEGDTVTTSIRGNQFKTIESPCSCYLVVLYSVGYGSGNPIPFGLKRALLEEIAFRYQHRGEELNTSICQPAIELATPYKRKSFIA